MSSLNHYLDISQEDENKVKEHLRCVFNLPECIVIDIQKNESKITRSVIVTITNPDKSIEHVIEGYNFFQFELDYELSVVFNNISFKHDKYELPPYFVLFSNLYLIKGNNHEKNPIEKLEILANLSFKHCKFYIDKKDTLKGIVFKNKLGFNECIFINNCFLCDSCVFYDSFSLIVNSGDKINFINTQFYDLCNIVINNAKSELEFLNVEFYKPFDCFACNLHNIKQVSFIDVLFKDYCHLSELGERDTYPSELPIYKQKEINYKSKVVFKHTVFEKPLNFQNVNFENGFEFAEVNCYKKVIFSNGVSSLNEDGEREIFLQNSVFKDEVDFSEVSFENKILHIDKTTFEKSFSLTMVDNNMSSVNAFGKGLVIKNSFFAGNVNLSYCCFNYQVIIFNCTFKSYIQIHRSYFQDKVRFEKNIVNKIISFDKSEFKEEVVFDYTIFNDILSLLFVIFHKAPKFALAKFTNSANIQTFNLRIGESNEELNEDCYRKENIESKLNELKARTDTFRLIKDQAIKNNDLLVATEQKKLELYARELELDYCKKINGVEYLPSVYQKTTPESVKITTIEVFDRLFLKLNRTISDHHTDFLKILLFTLSVIGGYFMINLNLSFSLFGLKDNSPSNIVLLLVLALNTLFLMCLLFKRAKRDLRLILTRQRFFKMKNFFKRLRRYSCILKYGKYLLILLVLFLFFIIYFVDSMMVLSIMLPLAFALTLFVIVTLFYEDSKATILDDIKNNTIFKIKYTALSFAIFGIVGIVSSPSIITPFLGAFSEDARNHYLYKAIDELDDKKALKLARIILPNDKDLKEFEPSKTILSKNAKLEQISIFDKTDLSVNFIYEQSNQDKNEQSIYKAKKILKDYKDELKSSKLLNESPELKRAVAIDGGVSRLNIAYYLVLAFCIFALQKTMRKNSIIPS